MEKLKTLKDLGEIHIAGKGYIKGSVDRYFLKEEAIKWIKLAKRYDELNEERKKTEKDYHQLNSNDYQTDKYYDICINPFQKEEAKLDKEFEKVGIKFACANYEYEDYCLSPEGLILLLKVVFNINEKDLK